MDDLSPATRLSTAERRNVLTSDGVAMRNEVRTFSREKGITHNQVQDIEVKDLNPRPRTGVGSNPSADVMSIRTLRFSGRTRIKVPFALHQILTHYTYRKTPNLET